MAIENTLRKKGFLYIVSAPSGAGKTSLVRDLAEHDSNVRVSVSHTTRAPREGEREGEAYYFVDPDTFRSMSERDEFMERAEVFDHQYGTSRVWVEEQLDAGHDVVLEIDWQGARQIRDRQVRERCADTVRSVFILPPDLKELRARLWNRKGTSEEVVRRRMRDAEEQMSHYREYDYIVVNDEFERACMDMRAIFQANRLAYRCHAPAYDEFLRGMEGRPAGESP